MVVAIVLLFEERIIDYMLTLILIKLHGTQSKATEKKMPSLILFPNTCECIACFKSNSICPRTSQGWFVIISIMLLIKKRMI